MLTNLFPISPSVPIAAIKGTKLAHYEGGVPNIEISIPKVSPTVCGEMVYFYEYACGVSGYMLGVNPFDQPGVEDYKNNMFTLLGKKGKKDKKDSKMTIDADTLSRAEILAPGVSEDEDMEMESLRQAYKDAGTKVIIDSLLGGRHFGEMRGDSALRHVVFVGASEIVRAQRGSPVSSLAGRYVSDGINAGKTPEVMTSSKYGQILKAAWKK